MSKQICSNYPLVVPTVDIAVLSWIGDELHILVGRKKGCKGFQLPGGFVDITDGSWEAAAKRELFEETNIDVEVKKLKYYKSSSIKDKRFDGKTKQILSTLFVIHIPCTNKLEAKDDLLDLRWLAFEDFSTINVEPVHHPWVEALSE